jgi:hypothetical protein
MLLARFREERLAGQSAERAISTMLSTTWRPTLAAASAAAAAYGSLVFTDFRGFAQFGWIGGVGMLVCWAAAVLLIPVFASIWGPGMPAQQRSARVQSRRGVLAVLFGHPRAVLIATLAVTVISVLGLARRGSNGWIEYDLSKLRRRDAWTTGERYWGRRMDDTMGRFLTPVVVLADDAEQARVIEARLKKLRDEGKAGGLIASVRGPADVLPPGRERSLSEAKAIAKALTPKLREKLDASQRKIVERATSPAALRLLTAKDLPPTLAAGLREKNGRMDRSVLLFPKTGGGTWDATKLDAFARDLREAANVNGKRGTVTGALLLSSDIAIAMTKDGPIATALSLIAVLGICVLAFRSLSLSLAAVTSLFAGVAMMLGAMAWAGQKLNFSNFVALPITFGIAADYSINVLKRYQQEGKLDLGSALNATGGAVALCSATTIIGYGSLLVAQNQALFSFGVFAVTGELTCLLTAVIALPAALRLFAARREPES